MALIIGLRPVDRFYIGDVPVEVSEFHDPTHARVEVEGKVFNLSEKESTEIYPLVFVSCGRPSASQKNKHQDMLAAAKLEQRQRHEAVESGQITQEQYSMLPPVVFPFDLLPRLVIEAPRNLLILRAELYERGSQSVRKQRVGQAGLQHTIGYTR